MFLRRGVDFQGSEGPEDNPISPPPLSAEEGVARGALAVKAP